MSALRNVIARMAVDSEFARHARANPDQVAREHGLSAEEAAKLRGLADAGTGSGPMALGARLSKSGFGTGGLGAAAAEMLQDSSQEDSDPDFRFGFLSSGMEGDGGDEGTGQSEPQGESGVGYGGMGSLQDAMQEPLQSGIGGDEGGGESEPPEQPEPTLSLGSLEDAMQEQLLGGGEEESGGQEGGGSSAPVLEVAPGLSETIKEALPGGGGGPVFDLPGGPVAELPEGFQPPFVPEEMPGGEQPGGETPQVEGLEDLPGLERVPEGGLPGGDGGQAEAPPQAGSQPDNLPPDPVTPPDPVAPPDPVIPPEPVTPQAIVGDQPGAAIGQPTAGYAGPAGPGMGPAAAGIGGVSGQAQSLLPPDPFQPPDHDQDGSPPPDDDSQLGGSEIAVGAAGAAGGAVAGGIGGAIAGKAVGKAADNAPGNAPGGGTLPDTH